MTLFINAKRKEKGGKISLIMLNWPLKWYTWMYTLINPIIIIFKLSMISVWLTDPSNSSVLLTFVEHPRSPFNFVFSEIEIALHSLQWEPSKASSLVFQAFHTLEDLFFYKKTGIKELHVCIKKINFVLKFHRFFGQW